MDTTLRLQSQLMWGDGRLAYVAYKQQPGQKELLQYKAH
jgi:hypothetical protein